MSGLANAIHSLNTARGKERFTREEHRRLKDLWLLLGTIASDSRTTRPRKPLPAADVADWLRLVGEAIGELATEDQAWAVAPALRTRALLARVKLESLRASISARAPGPHGRPRLGEWKLFTLAQAKQKAVETIVRDIRDVSKIAAASFVRECCEHHGVPAEPKAILDAGSRARRRAKRPAKSSRNRARV